MTCQHLAGPRMEEVQWIAGLRPDRDVHGRGFKPVLHRVLPPLFSSSTLLPGETGIPGGKSGWKANLLRMPSLPTWSAAVATLGRATGSPAQPPSCLPTSRSTTSSPQLLFELAPPPPLLLPAAPRGPQHPLPCLPLSSTLSKLPTHLSSNLIPSSNLSLQFQSQLPPDASKVSTKLFTNGCYAAQPTSIALPALLAQQREQQRLRRGVLPRSCPCSPRIFSSPDACILCHTLHIPSHPAEEQPILY